MSANQEVKVDFPLIAIDSPRSLQQLRWNETLDVLEVLLSHPPLGNGRDAAIISYYLGKLDIIYQELKKEAEADTLMRPIPEGIEIQWIKRTRNE